MFEVVVFFWLFLFEYCFGVTVVPLLFEVVTHAAAAVMPHDGPRMESQRSSLFDQTPAEVDIVPRDPKLLVETIDRQNRIPPERHVAAGQMLGQKIGVEDVARPARRVRNAVGDGTILVRREVGATDSDVIAR